MDNMDMTNQLLAETRIGKWVIEIDEGAEPRMYDDEVMKDLVGIGKDETLTPEETYRRWYDHIHPQHYVAVNDAVGRMLKGEHAEVQYPFFHPVLGEVHVRCGGSRNMAYTKGARFEGLHQDITSLVHVQINEDNILSGITKAMYGLNMTIDLDTGKYTLIAGTGLEEEVKVLSKIDDYHEACHVGFAMVDDKIAEEIYAVTNLDNLHAHVASGEFGLVKTFVYKTAFGGELKWNEMNVLVDRNPYGRPVANILIRRLDDKVIREREARISAERANEAKTAFLSNMSHDIRTPMNAIVGFTELARKHLDDRAAVANSLEKISDASKHLLLLINDILDMSRIESGKVKLERAPLDLKRDMMDAVGIVSASAKAKGVTLEADLSALKTQWIMVDKLRLNQVLFNIVSNAIKFTPDGGRIDLIARDLEPELEGTARVEFKTIDTGCGISREFLPRIFESFEREHNTTTSGIHGTGLGLAIVKKICDLSGTTLTVESEVGKGTVFTAVATFRKLTLEEIAKVEAKSITAKIGESTDYPALLKGVKALVVEDNDLNLVIAEGLLEEVGVKVETCSDGTEAVERMKNFKSGDFDLILMDIQMPVMNGYEATKAIRALDGEAAKTIPILAMTANAFEEDRKRALEAGMNGHVAKPIDSGKLYAAIAEAVR